MKSSIVKSAATVLPVLMMIIGGTGCGTTDKGNGDDESIEWVDNDDRVSDPEALVITADEMYSAWAAFADWKDRTGIRTDVILIDDITGAQSNPFLLREYLQSAYQKGVKYVLLGGDADQIPYLRGYTSVWALETYAGNAPIETFFEELDSDWDADNDGEYGEQGDDLDLEDLRDTEIAVGRVPVETEDEALGFINKLIKYECGAGKIAERAICPLFLGDVATSIPIIGDIDGGFMHESLIEAYIPEEMQACMQRFYATSLLANAVGAEIGTSDKIFDAYENPGYAYTVTNTHGSFSWLTNKMYLDDVKEMANEVPTVFITTSCLSGNFADRFEGVLQNGMDSVAEELVKNPNGGAVAYMGNTLVGLGPVGGVQFNHALTRSIFHEGHSILGDAIMNAKRTFHDEVTCITFGDFSMEFALDKVSLGQLKMPFSGTEWYTLRSLLLLGDPSMRVWTQFPTTLALDAPATFKEGYNVIHATVYEDGNPAQGIPVALSQLGGKLIVHESDANGQVQFNLMLEATDSVFLTAYEQGKVAANIELNPE